MFATDDRRAFEATADVARGNSAIELKYRDLAKQISRDFGTEVLNITQDWIGVKRDQIRLWIWFRTAAESKAFRDPNGNFDGAKQQAVIVAAGRTLSRLRTPKRGILPGPRAKAKDTLVIFCDFESPARDNAFAAASGRGDEQVRNSLDNPDLWKVMSLWSNVVFFVYTEEQAARYANGAERERWRLAYWQLVHPFDEFGFAPLESFQIKVDSKETFENKFEGSSYYYFL